MKTAVIVALLGVSLFLLVPSYADDVPKENQGELETEGGYLDEDSSAASVDSSAASEDNIEDRGEVQRYGYSEDNKDKKSAPAPAKKEPNCHIKAEMKCCKTQTKTYYYHDIKTKTCKAYSAKECAGNANNFPSKADCVKKCIPVVNRCTEPIVMDNCKDSTERYYFNKANGLCQRFPCDKCSKNKNNFKTYKECKPCMPKEIPACEQPMITIKCKTGDKKVFYYYDAKSNKCQAYKYPYIGSTQNNFPTKEKCEECVKDSCPKDQSNPKCCDPVNECCDNKDCCKGMVCCKTNEGNKCKEAIHKKVKGAYSPIVERDCDCCCDKK